MIATGPGLLCATCGKETMVTDSRPGQDCIRRRRQCVDPACTSPRVTTYERTETDWAGGHNSKQIAAAALSTLSSARRQLVYALIRELGGEAASDPAGPIEEVR